MLSGIPPPTNLRKSDSIREKGGCDKILVSGVAEAGYDREQFVRCDIPASMLDFVIVNCFRELFPSR